MPVLDIPCPQCGQKLRLPDRSMLGRKGKCAKCGTKFIMQEEMVASGKPKPSRAKEPPQFEFAGHTDSADDPGDRTLMGVKATWVNEAGAAERFQSPAAATPQYSAPPQSVMAAPEQEVLLAAADDDDVDVVARVRAQKKKQAKRRNMIVAGTVVALLVGAGAYFGLSKGGHPESKKGKGKGPASHESAAQPEDDGKPVASVHSGMPVSPTKGKPITLQAVPAGAYIVVNLRPAQLWQTGGTAEEFRACLGPVGAWLETAIKTYCLVEPAKIEEVLFALIPTGQDSFAVSVVVHLKADMKKSEMIDKFDGELVDSPRPHYVGETNAYVILDPRTYAICPKGLTEDLINAVDGTSVASDGMQAVLGRSDRERHFSIAFDVDPVRNGTKGLAAANAINFLNGIVDFFGDDAETVAWSFHVGDDSQGTNFFSELLVRNKLSRSVPNLERDLKKKLEALPAQILELVYVMHPQKIGEKKVIGRYPIMTKMVERSIYYDTSNRLVSLRVDLPERAAPNLALGTLLAWNETTKPDFGKTGSSSPQVAANAAGTQKLSERLQKKISVEFRNEFLYAAVAFVAEELGAEYKIEGNDLKMVGVTQNMRQQYKLDDVPAQSVFHTMLDKINLCLVIDEPKNLLIITSKQAAEEKKLTVFPTSPAPGK